MPRVEARSVGRTKKALLGSVLGAVLALASVAVASPAGASNQDITFTITPINFGSVVLGTSTTGQSIVTNTSAVSLSYVSAHPGSSSSGAEFHASAGTCTGALAPGLSCDVDVTFAPNAHGLRASTLTVKFGEKNTKGTVIEAASYDTSLQGRGVKPTFTLTGASAGNVGIGAIGTASATITNTSTVALTLHSWHLQNVVDHDFVITDVTCLPTVLPGGSCGITATFVPHHLGGASVTLDVSMLLAGTKKSLVSQQATLSGTGVKASGANPPFELTPLTFGTVTVGTTATGDVVLTNTSPKNETFKDDHITSDKYGAYAVIGNNCPSPIPSSTSCFLTVSYSPASAVVHNATLVVHVTHLNAKLATVTSSAQTSLTGQGVNPQFTLASSGFAATTVGASSSGQVTVTNESLVPLTYSATSFQGADGSSWSLIGSACTGPIAPGISCNLDVSFSPHGQGTLSETIQVTLDQTVRAHTSFITRRTVLAGDGTLPTFTVGAPTLAATPKGVAVTGLATITNTSNVSISYDGFGFSGPNAGDFTVTGSTCTGLIAPTGSCDLTVQFTPSAASPGTESASLKVIVLIAGIVPAITTSENTAVSGQES